MKHEDWLYLIEMHMKHGDSEAAKTVAQAMNKYAEVDEKLRENLARAEQIIKQQGHTAHYFKP